METSKEARTRKLSSNYGVSSRPTFINNEVIVPGNCFEIFNALGLTHVIILLVNHMILFSSRMFFLHKPYKFYELASLLYAKVLLCPDTWPPHRHQRRRRSGSVGAAGHALPMLSLMIHLDDGRLSCCVGTTCSRTTA
uniref:Uncharacterized protein n=1 Tax=Triticum urartu TaxID=4572 RepID=A0A8R7V300_TRIUA